MLRKQKTPCLRFHLTTAADFEFFHRTVEAAAESFACDSSTGLGGPEQEAAAAVGNQQTCLQLSATDPRYSEFAADPFETCLQGTGFARSATVPPGPSGFQSLAAPLRERVLGISERRVLPSRSGPREKKRAAARNGFIVRRRTRESR